MAGKDLQSLLTDLKDKLERKDPSSSTVRLVARGKTAVMIKLIEEAAEIWMAFRFESDTDLALEISQYWYYLMVLGLLTEESGWSDRVAAWPLNQTTDGNGSPKKLVQETAALAIHSGSITPGDLEKLFHLSWEVGKQKQLSLSSVYAHL